MILKKLEKIAKSPDTELEGEVAEIMFEKAKEEYDGNVEGVFKDLLYGGCASGMISGLIYYTDTHKFYDKYYEDIENLITEWEKETGERVAPKESGDDRKNYLAWWGFESQAQLIAEKLGLEI